MQVLRMSSSAADILFIVEDKKFTLISKLFIIAFTSKNNHTHLLCMKTFSLRISARINYIENVGPRRIRCILKIEALLI
jgi:hypothetical protein